MISNYERQYMEITKNILRNGYYGNNRTGMPTYKLPHQVIEVDLEKEFPILKSKFVAFKTAIKEILWIMSGDNSVINLQNQNCHIWDEWKMEDGTIGTSYGWVVKNFNQVDNLINQLKNNPQDRRMMINLWQWDYLEGGALAPCCFCSMWDVTDGKLNCMLIQRSADWLLGNPFNTTQYATLTHILAHICGLKVGKLTHVINNAHIYENQTCGGRKQLENFNSLCTIDNINKLKTNSEIKHDMSRDLLYSFDELLPICEYEPILIMNKDKKDFKDFTFKDVSLNGYKIGFGNMGKIDMPVSV